MQREYAYARERTAENVPDGLSVTLPSLHEAGDGRGSEVETTLLNAGGMLLALVRLACHGNDLRELWGDGQLYNIQNYTGVNTVVACSMCDLYRLFYKSELVWFDVSPLMHNYSIFLHTALQSQGFPPHH